MSDASPPPSGRTAALIVAAGRGARAGGGLPKQYRTIAGRSVLAHTVAVFAAHPRIDEIRVVIHPEDRALYDAGLPAHEKLGAPVAGGSSRAESVLNGLCALDGDTALVLIHDAARPFLDGALIDRVCDALRGADGAIPSVAAVDAMRRVAADGTLGDAVPREGVGRVQTPQGFRHAAILGAMERAARGGALAGAPDEATTALAAGLRVVAVAGDPDNLKLTSPEDLRMAERLFAPPAPDIRTGQGFDVHAFAEGDHVVLCGMRIPHTHGLAGHSDADVALHALTDALYGAVAEGDIGRHFPPDDPQWKGCDSAVFLRHAVETLARRGFRIGNLDLTLICERPKITPHAPAMRARIAELCTLEVDRVSVKATTTERLGFCGRGEGIAAMATATVIGSGT